MQPEASVPIATRLSVTGVKGWYISLETALTCYIKKNILWAEISLLHVYLNHKIRKFKTPPFTAWLLGQTSHHTLPEQTLQPAASPHFHPSNFFIYEPGLKSMCMNPLDFPLLPATCSAQLRADRNTAVSPSDCSMGPIDNHLKDSFLLSRWHRQ